MGEKSSRFLELFKVLADALQLPELYFDNNGACQLTFGDGLAVTLGLDSEADVLTIYAVVADLAEAEDRSEILTSLMEGNYFWGATEGFTLSIAEDSWKVVLAGRQDVSYFEDAAFLHEYILTFADTVRDWAELCSAALPQSDAQ